MSYVLQLERHVRIPDMYIMWCFNTILFTSRNPRIIHFDNILRARLDVNNVNYREYLVRQTTT